MHVWYCECITLLKTETQAFCNLGGFNLMNIMYHTNGCEGRECAPEKWKIRICCTISAAKAKQTSVAENLNIIFKVT